LSLVYLQFPAKKWQKITCQLLRIVGKIPGLWKDCRDPTQIARIDEIFVRENCNSSSLLSSCAIFTRSRLERVVGALPVDQLLITTDVRAYQDTHWNCDDESQTQ